MRFDFLDGRASGVNGQLGGVLDAEELAQAVGDWAAALTPDLGAPRRAG